MSDENMLDAPKGRAAALFGSKELAESAKAALIDQGFQADDINTAHGPADAQQLDDSARWFADTDDHIEMYKDQLGMGGSALTVPVEGEKQIAQVRDVFRANGASMMTHFGGLVTKSEAL